MRVLRLQAARTLLAIVAIVCCRAAVAGLTEGYEALIRTDYATAIKEYRPLAERGNADAQYRIGRMYEFGQGYPQDKAQGITWIRKAAAQNHADAQQELGFIYASGNGVKRDDAQAIDWWRKAATQGNEDAQLKLAVVYHTGQGAAKDDVLALANATIAARGGDHENVDYRNEIAQQLTPEQRRRAQALADAWKVGQAMPGSAAASVSTGSATAAPAAPVKTRCSATGTMGGEKFAASNCVASLYGDAHSVAIWFNEDPITPAEAESFQLSSYAQAAKGGKQRTMAIIMFCPGGGKATASASAVKSIDLNTHHARSPMAGIQRVVEAPKDFRV